MPGNFFGVRWGAGQLHFHSEHKMPGIFSSSEAGNPERAGSCFEVQLESDKLSRSDPNSESMSRTPPFDTTEVSFSSSS